MDFYKGQIVYLNSSDVPMTVASIRESDERQVCCAWFEATGFKQMMFDKDCLSLTPFKPYKPIS